MIVYIYALVDPDTDEVRYVGKSVNPLSRYRDHCNDLYGSINPRKVAWTKALKAQRKKPVMKILEECTEETWWSTEKHWIDHYRSTVFNRVDGGVNTQKRLRAAKKLKTDSVQF